MEYETIQGESVPKIGLGTVSLSDRECRTTVRTALELGYRHVDTAQGYRNEEPIGQAITDSNVDREELFLTTKVDPMRLRLNRETIIRSVDESLDRLGTDYVDLLLIHWSNPLASTKEVMETFADLREGGGKTRHVGVSNFGVEKLSAARNVSPAPVFADQVMFHTFSPKPELLDYCRSHDVLLTAYSPLAHGGALYDPLLQKLGEKYDKFAAQVALRWLVQHDGLVTIPKATSRSHLESNLTVFDFELTDTEMKLVARPS